MMFTFVYKKVILIFKFISNLLFNKLKKQLEKNFNQFTFTLNVTFGFRGTKNFIIIPY